MSISSTLSSQPRPILKVYVCSGLAGVTGGFAGSLPHTMTLVLDCCLQVEPWVVMAHPNKPSRNIGIHSNMACNLSSSSGQSIMSSTCQRGKELLKSGVLS